MNNTRKDGIKSITITLITAFLVICSAAFADTNPVPLFSAAINGDAAAIQKAIASGIDVDISDPNGWTPLMAAVNSGKPLAVKALLKARPHIDAKNIKGLTALMIAAILGNSDIVKMLLDSGADVTITTPKGVTALDFAKSDGKKPIILLLENAAASAAAKAAKAAEAAARAKAEADAKALAESKALDAKMEQAAQAFKDENYSRSVELFRELSILRPKNDFVWHFLGQSLAKTNDVMGARRAFTRVLEIRPDGTLAERTRKMLAKLPDPDLFTLKIDDALTLGDWMPIAEKQVTQGKQSEVLQQVEQYLSQLGPVPQLQRLRNKLLQERQAQQDRELQQAISGIKVKDAETAQAALPKVRQLKQQYPVNLKLLMLEAQACHFTQDYKCATDAYSAWLNAASGNQPGRKRMVEGLLLAKQQQPLLRGKKVIPDLPIAIDDESRSLLEISGVFQDWPDGETVTVRTRKKEIGKTSYKSSITNSESETNSLIDLFGNGISKAEITYSNTNDAGKSNFHLEKHSQVYEALGGLINLSKEDYSNLGEFKDGVWHYKPAFSGKFDTTNIIKLKAITGTLFPLGSGATLTVQYEYMDQNGKLSSEAVKTCKSGEKIAANSLHPKLSGDAYKIECTYTGNYYADGKGYHNDFISVDYLIESLATFASNLGAHGKTDIKSKPYITTYFFPPESGTSISENNYGGVNDMTHITSYDPVSLDFVK